MYIANRKNINKGSGCVVCYNLVNEIKFIILHGNVRISVILVMYAKKQLSTSKSVCEDLCKINWKYKLRIICVAYVLQVPIRSKL